LTSIPGDRRGTTNLFWQLPFNLIESPNGAMFVQAFARGISTRLILLPPCFLSHLSLH
jgi:hypothetical protein